MQIIILFSLILWSITSNPIENLTFIITVGLIIAIASATQDITVDALRIEQIGENEGKSMAAGAAMAVVGWWSVVINLEEFYLCFQQNFYKIKILKITGKLHF